MASESKQPSDHVTVRRSTGNGFGPNEGWTGGPYYGSRGIFFADVDGDGRADAIVVNESLVSDPVTVPDVLELWGASAANIIYSAGLKYELIPSSKSNNGYVRYQLPRSGTVAERGSTVKLFLRYGSPL
jgi:hypothetical protein